MNRTFSDSESDGIMSTDSSETKKDIEEHCPKFYLLHHKLSSFFNFATGIIMADIDIARLLNSYISPKDIYTDGDENYVRLNSRFKDLLETSRISMKLQTLHNTILSKYCKLRIIESFNDPNVNIDFAIPNDPNEPNDDIPAEELDECRHDKPLGWETWSNEYKTEYLNNELDKYFAKSSKQENSASHDWELLYSY